MRSLAWDLWLGSFGSASSVGNLWLGIFALDPSDWDLWLEIFGFGTSGLGNQANGAGGIGRGGSAANAHKVTPIIESSQQVRTLLGKPS